MFLTDNTCSPIPHSYEKRILRRMSNLLESIFREELLSIPNDSSRKLNLDIETEYVASLLRKNRSAAVLSVLFFLFFWIIHRRSNTIIKHDRVHRERRVARTITPWDTMLSEFTTMR